MSAAFDKALAFTLGIEGSESDDAADHGGLTNEGVTQREYDSWRERHSLDSQSVHEITVDELRALYFEDYWTPCRCEEMPAGLGAAVFDMAVNSGQTNAAITLQESLHVRADGAIGPMTLLAAQNAKTPALAFLMARGAFYRDDVVRDPTQLKFLDGWFNRLLLQAWNGGNP